MSVSLRGRTTWNRARLSWTRTPHLLKRSAMKWKTTRASLLARIRDTDDDLAWAEFDSVYGELILRYCRRRGLGLADAEDIRQIVLLSLARTLPRFEFRPERGRFRGYLGRTLRNAIFRYRTSPKSALPALLEGEYGPADEDPTDSEHERVWEEEWRNHHLRRAFATLAENHEPRSLEVFRDLLAGVTVAEIAKRREMTTEAVYKVQQRMRERLKALVAEQVAEEEAGL